MAAFQFPDPAITQRVVHPVTNTVYEWKEPPGKWVIVVGQSVNETEAIEKLEVDVSALQANDTVQDGRLDAIEALPVPKDYMIGTDKNITRIAEPRLAPAIELVDSEGFFSNVKFEATGGLAVTSTASSIVFDGSNIDAGTAVDLDNYYTKAEVNSNLDGYYTKPEADGKEDHLQNQIDELLVTKGAVVTYELVDIALQVASRPGQMYVDNTLVSAISFISLAAEDKNGLARPLGALGDIIEIVKAGNITYRFEISTASDGIAGVTHVGGTGSDLLIAGMEFGVFIYPQNKATASIEYVDQTVANYFPIAGGTFTGSVSFNRGEKDYRQFKIAPNAGDFSTNIYAFGGGQLRFRTSPTGDESDYRTHIVITDKNDTPETRIYKLIEPTQQDMPATKNYVDTVTAQILAGDVDLSNHPGGTFIGPIDFNRAPNDISIRFKANSEELARFHNDTIGMRLAINEGKEFKFTSYDDNGGQHQVLKVWGNGEIRLEHCREPELSHHSATKKYVDDLVAATGAFSGGPLSQEIDQNEEQLQAISTNLLNALSEINALKTLDINNAISELQQARQDIIDLKSKVLSLEQQIHLNLE